MSLDLATLAAHAIRYAENGLEVFPVNPRDKTPLISQYEATVDIGIIDGWWHTWPNALIGHRLPADQVILDIDPRHCGLTTWNLLKETYGQLPRTRYHASGRGDGGGHLWWLRPDDHLAIEPLDRWAREHGTGHAVLNRDSKPTGRWVSGIDLLHRDHRYTILPPSPHPDSHEPYVWKNGLEQAVVAMPAWLADLITKDQPATPPKPAPASSDPDSIATWYTENHPFSTLLPRYGWTLRAGNGDDDGSRWRHPTATSSFSATVRYGYLFAYSPNTPLEPTTPGEPHGYTPFAVHALYEHAGDQSAAARAARALKDGPAPARIDPAELIAPQAASSNGAVPAASKLHLPEELWAARPVLEHIRQAARSKLIAPDAVLGCVLARVAAITPHPVELPAPVGVPVGLTYFVGLVGPPEAGKSAAAGIAAELIPAPADIPDRLPIGSGEGVVEILFDLTEVEGPNGKKRKEKHQTRHAAIFHIDEGQVLTELGSRQGTTLLPTLRTAYTHGTLGNANASSERKRIVPGTSYVYGITLGIQPELAAPLLADTAGGTPQRFVWLMAVDPDVQPGHVWPGPLDWQRPDPGNLEPHAITRAGFKRYQLDIDDSISDEIINDRIQRQRGHTTPGDEHQMLVRYKTAALLALLDRRLDVNLDDWRLAGIITATSRQVRNSVRSTIAVLEQQRDQAGMDRYARRELTVEAKRETAALQRAARRAGKTVHEHHAAGVHPDTGCARRCIHHAIASRDRALVSTDDAIDEARKLAWLTVDGEHYRPGDARPV